MSKFAEVLQAEGHQPAACVIVSSYCWYTQEHFNC